MKNTVTVTIPFSFKGKEHQPSIVVDLDNYLKHNQDFSGIFHLVATKNNIGNYSYEYEVLESSEIKISNPTGAAIDYLKGNTFDFEAYSQYLKNSEVTSKLETIAKETLNIDNLDAHNDIKEALRHAYNAGVHSQHSI